MDYDQIHDLREGILERQELLQACKDRMENQNLTDQEKAAIQDEINGHQNAIIMGSEAIRKLRGEG